MIRSLLAILIFAMAWLVQPAWAAPTELPVLEVRAGEDAPNLAPFIRFAKRPGDSRTPQLNAILQGPLQRVEGSTIHFGPPGTRTVVLLQVRNASDEQGSWILTTGRGSLKHFRLYEAKDGRLALAVDATDPQTARQNLGTYQAFSSELVLGPRQGTLIVIEFISENSTYMPLKIESYGTFFKERRANISMVSGVVVGALILLLLNFLFFSITGFKEFLWLAVAEAFFALNTVHSEGYITIFFLYDKPLTGLAVEDFIKCGFAASMAQFCRSFVKTPTNFPRRDMVLKALIWFALAIMLFQPGLAYYPPELRFLLHIATWLVAVAVALFLPFVGYAAMKQLGFQLWPLFIGWASLALFIVYAAIASMGIFAWLPVNWHLAGPVGLFESVMVTVALGLNLKKIQRDKVVADWKYAQSLTERLEMSERATRIRADESDEGTGSGFGSAQRIIETLRGSLKIIASSVGGTEIRIVLPAAFPSVTPVSAETLQSQLDGWKLLDFDDRTAFEARLNAADTANGQTIALTYDDTTVTRGRLSQLVAMMAIKPACREMAMHPLLGERSEQV